MSQLIYIETSIPSFYHETRAARQFQTMREWTREWWDIARLRDELVTSLAVITELEDAPAPKRMKALKLLEPLPLLQSSETIDEMVAVYVKHKVMPADATGDARHLALATFIAAMCWRAGTASTLPTGTSAGILNPSTRCWATRHRCPPRRLDC